MSEKNYYLTYRMRAPLVKAAKVRVALLKKKGLTPDPELELLASLDEDKIREEDTENASKGFPSNRMITASTYQAAKLERTISEQLGRKVDPRAEKIISMGRDEIQNRWRRQRNLDLAELDELERCEDKQGLARLLRQQGHDEAAEIVEQWFGLQG